jgi:catechol 2,3-dioxygenase-like lactoylglutathione lyase family enzyme
MQTHFSHIQFNVSASNMQFYRDIMTCLGWAMIYDSPEMIGTLGKNGESLWFSANVKAVSNNYDGPGMNHIGISAPTPADVDTAAEYLTGKGVQMLFGTPRHRPEFSANDNQTYYQIMFESPDRILWEVVYTGPKA